MIRNQPNAAALLSDPMMIVVIRHYPNAAATLPDVLAMFRQEAVL